MHTKEEYADTLRDVLDTDIEFERLLKEDLVKLTEILNEIMRENQKDNNNNSNTDNKNKSPLNKLMDAGITFAKNWDGPVVKNLRNKTKEKLESEN